MYSSCDKKMPSKQTWKSKFLEKLQKLFNGERHFTTTLKSHIFTCFVDYRNYSSVRRVGGEGYELFVTFFFCYTVTCKP